MTNSVACGGVPFCRSLLSWFTVLPRSNSVNWEGIVIIITDSLANGGDKRCNLWRNYITYQLTTTCSFILYIPVYIWLLYVRIYQKQQQQSLQGHLWIKVFRWITTLCWFCLDTLHSHPFNSSSSESISWLPVNPLSHVMNIVTSWPLFLLLEYRCCVSNCITCLTPSSIIGVAYPMKLWKIRCLSSLTFYSCTEFWITSCSTAWTYFQPMRKP